MSFLSNLFTTSRKSNKTRIPRNARRITCEPLEPRQLLTGTVPLVPDVPMVDGVPDYPPLSALLGAGQSASSLGVGFGTASSSSSGSDSATATPWNDAVTWGQGYQNLQVGNLSDYNGAGGWSIYSINNPFTGSNLTLGNFSMSGSGGMYTIYANFNSSTFPNVQWVIGSLTLKNSGANVSINMPLTFFVGTSTSPPDLTGPDLLYGNTNMATNVSNDGSVTLEPTQYTAAGNYSLYVAKGDWDQTSGTFTNNFGGTVTILPGVLTNATMSVGFGGTVTNAGTLNAQTTIYDVGTLNNSNILDNSGTILISYARASAWLTNTGTLSNTGVINVAQSGTYGTLTDDGTVSNSGTISVYGTYTEGGASYGVGISNSGAGIVDVAQGGTVDFNSPALIVTATSLTNFQQVKY